MDLDVQVRLTVYQHFATTGERPEPRRVAERVGSDVATVVDVYARLADKRLLVLEDDGESIRMASPFSGVPTQHVVESAGVQYFANCAWDSLGVIAALRRPGDVHSRCEQSGEPLDMHVAVDGPGSSDWVFHCHIPTARWWDDIVFT